MAKTILRAQELKKLGTSVETIPPNLRFYCVVCEEFRFGVGNFSFVVGGWYCPTHLNVKSTLTDPSNRRMLVG